jgi:hypothetical protein
LSEIANATVFQREPHHHGLSRPGFQMSIVAQGQHYVRDGTGAEQLYDLTKDPAERKNLLESPGSDHLLAPFRKMLLDALTQERGSREVEAAYLQPYRMWLEAIVSGSISPNALEPRARSYSYKRSHM